MCCQRVTILQNFKILLYGSGIPEGVVSGLLCQFSSVRSAQHRAVPSWREEIHDRIAQSTCSRIRLPGVLLELVVGGGGDSIGNIARYPGPFSCRTAAERGPAKTMTNALENRAIHAPTVAGCGWRRGVLQLLLACQFSFGETRRWCGRYRDSLRYYREPSL